jgi:hypothetical protein
MKTAMDYLRALVTGECPGIPVPIPFELNAWQQETDGVSCMIHRSTFQEIMDFLQGKPPEINPPRRPTRTTIWSEQLRAPDLRKNPDHMIDVIRITTGSAEIQIPTEHASFYLVFEHDVIVHTYKRSIQIGLHVPDRHEWVFGFVRGAPRTEIRNYMTRLEFADNDFIRHTTCGKDLGLACAMIPCPVCKSRTTTAAPVSDKPPPSVPTPNPLTPRQEEFCREIAWPTALTDYGFQQRLVDMLLERHARERVSCHENQEPASLTLVLLLMQQDHSIPLGWVLQQKTSVAWEAYSALSLAHIANHLQNAGVIDSATTAKLREPWTRISPGRSEYANGFDHADIPF